MSKELTFVKKDGKTTVGRLRQAGTVHPNESASQVSSNPLHNVEEAEEDRVDIKRKMALKKRQSDLETGSKMTTSKVLVPFVEKARTKEGSVASSTSSPPKGKILLRVEDISSDMGNLKVSKSDVTTNSKTLAKYKPLVDAESNISKADSAASKLSSRASKHASEHGEEQVASEVSKASSEKIPASTAQPSKSTVSISTKIEEIESKVSYSSRSSKRESTVASSSRQSDQSGRGGKGALVLADKTEHKVSSLANEIFADDLYDIYSISIHQRGPIAGTRDELLAAVMKYDPKLEFDDATTIVDKKIALQKDKSVVSKATKFKRSDYKSDISNAETATNKGALVPSSDSKALTLPGLCSSLLLTNAPSSLLKLDSNQDSSSSSSSDLLALANLRAQGDLQRANAVAAFEANRATRGSDLERTRLLELELAKQSLQDHRTLTQLQQLALHDEKLKALARHAHEDQLVALTRAEAEEARRRDALKISALRELEVQESARNRLRRGELAKDERRRQGEGDQRTQMEYERLDHDQKMEKIDAFERLVDAGRPRNAPQPRRGDLVLGYGYNYTNLNTGAEGSVNMRISQGCTNTGIGACGKCGLDLEEHPYKKHSDGSITGASGRKLAGPGGSTVSETVSKR